MERAAQKWAWGRSGGKAEVMWWKAEVGGGKRGREESVDKEHEKA